MFFFVWLFAPTRWRVRDVDTMATAFNWIKFVYSWGDSMAWLVVLNKPALIAVVLMYIVNRPQISVAQQMALSLWVDYLNSRLCLMYLCFSIYGKGVFFVPCDLIVFCFDFLFNEILNRCVYYSSALHTTDQGFHFTGCVCVEERGERLRGGNYYVSRGWGDLFSNCRDFSVAPAELGREPFIISGLFSILTQMLLSTIKGSLGEGGDELSSVYRCKGK